MGNTIYASFNDSSLAEKAAGALLDRGVRAEDLSIVQKEDGVATVANYDAANYPEGYVDPNTAVSTTMSPPAAASMYATTPPAQPGQPIVAEHNVHFADEDKGDIEGAAKTGISTTTAADAGAGALKGTAWGAGIGAIAAIASLAIPGFGLVIGGGALAAAIGGMVATTGAGAIAGAVTGYLKDQGMDEHVISHYENVVTNGGAILAVTIPSGNVSEFDAQTVLEKYGATQINSYAARGYVA